jgi:hypothetical protein
MRYCAQQDVATARTDDNAEEGTKAQESDRTTRRHLGVVMENRL